MILAPALYCLGLALLLGGSADGSAGLTLPAGVGVAGLAVALLLRSSTREAAARRIMRRER